MAQAATAQRRQRPRPEAEDPHDMGTENYPAHFLQGTWVGTFSGFIHADPPRPTNTRTPSAADLPPQLGGYYVWTDGTFFQYHGYELIASSLALRFNPPGDLIGRLVFNRGGRKVIFEYGIKGKYKTFFIPTVHVIQGRFNTRFTTANNQVVDHDWDFVMRSETEMHCLWLRGTRDGAVDRGTVMEGVLTRVQERLR